MCVCGVCVCGVCVCVCVCVCVYVCVCVRHGVCSAYLPTIPVFPVLYREIMVTTGIPGLFDFDRKTTGIGTQP